MKHKVSELEGALLDAAVAKAAGMILVFENSDRLDPTVNELDGRYCKPSTDWRIGGRIIETSSTNGTTVPVAHRLQGGRKVPA